MIRKKKIILFPILFLIVLGILFVGTLFVYVSNIECLIYKYFHVYCPGCGITRSIHELMRLNIVRSIRFYPTLYVVLLYVLFRYFNILFSFEDRYSKVYYRINIFLIVLIPASALIHCLFLNFV